MAANRCYDQRRIKADEKNGIDDIALGHSIASICSAVRQPGCGHQPGFERPKCTQGNSTRFAGGIAPRTAKARSTPTGTGESRPVAAGPEQAPGYNPGHGRNHFRGREQPERNEWQHKRKRNNRYGRHRHCGRHHTEFHRLEHARYNDRQSIDTWSLRGHGHESIHLAERQRQPERFDTYLEPGAKPHLCDQQHDNYQDNHYDA